MKTKKVKRGGHQDGKKQKEREAKLVKVSVRCLGPGKEHTFMSVDKRGRRICPQCTILLDKMTTAPLLRQIFKITNSNGTPTTGD